VFERERIYPKNIFVVDFTSNLCINC